MEGALDSDIASQNSQGVELTSLPSAPTGQDDGATMENIEEALDSDRVSHTTQSVETVENLKMKERSGNTIENKGPPLSSRERSGNVIETTRLR